MGEFMKTGLVPEQPFITKSYTYLTTIKLISKGEFMKTGLVPELQSNHYQAVQLITPLPLLFTIVTIR